MRDLISRNELLKCFCINKNGQRIPEVDCDNIEVTVSIKDVKRIIREQPTAFDTEKVVEQLEERTLNSKSAQTEAIIGMCGASANYYHGEADAYINAIDIVKKGGVE